MRSAWATALLLAAACLAACTPVVTGRGPEIRTPVLTDTAIIAGDGASLALTRWPAPDPRAVLIALHGMNDYAHAFALPGPWFAEQGVSVLAIDQRGFGRNPDPGLWAGTQALTADLRDTVRAVRVAHPGLPVWVLGESMGGAVVMAAVSDPEGLEADGLILSAPAVWGWSTLGWPGRAALWLTAHLQPWGPLDPPRGIRIEPSDNRAVLRGLSQDPLFIKRTRADALYGLVTLMERAYQGAGSVPAPVLVLYGARDDIIPPGPVRNVLARMPQARVALYPNGYHLLLRDLQRTRVWADILSFMQDPLAPLPSGAETAPAGLAAR